MELSWIQRYALMALLRAESVRVKDMIPPDVTANLFSYHLDGLLVAKLIEKTGRGTYALTTKGQKFAGKFSTLTNYQAEEIKTVIMLYAKQGDDYLLFRWSRQPYLDKVTPLYDRVPLGKSLHDGIHSALHDKLGVELPVMFKTAALIKIMKDGEVVSHMNAYIYEIDGGALHLPCDTRNGTAFFADAEDEYVMQGVSDFLEKVERANEPFEAIWQY